jgi:hypothetical protein
MIFVLRYIGLFREMGNLSVLGKIMALLAGLILKMYFLWGIILYLNFFAFLRQVFLYMGDYKQYYKLGKISSLGLTWRRQNVKISKCEVGSISSRYTQQMMNCQYPYRRWHL